MFNPAQQYRPVTAKQPPGPPQMAPQPTTPPQPTVQPLEQAADPAPVLQGKPQPTMLPTPRGSQTRGGPGMFGRSQGQLPPPPPPATNTPTVNLRGDVYTPGNDPRLKDAQTRTDNAAYDLNRGVNERGANQIGQESRYRNVFGSGQVNAGNFTVDPNVQYRGVGTQVNAGAINPNVAFNSVDPNVAGQQVDTQVAKGPAVDPMESARTSRYGTAQDQALDGLGGPSRTELAQRTLADFDAQADVARQGQFRKVGQTAAKFGRIGMGDVNAELGSIEGDFQRDRLQKQNELAQSVAEGDISDRFRRVDATSGLRRGEAGIDAGLRGENRIERDYGTGLDERNVNRAFDDRDYQTGLDERNVSRGMSERDSALGLAERNQGRAMDERGFRVGLDSENLDRAGRERDLETALAERNTGRRMSERDVGLGIATGNEERGFARNKAAIDAATAQTDRGVRDRFDQFDAAGSLEDRVFGQGLSNRDEYRTERGYQQGNAQQTIENRIKERELQQSEEEMRLRRAALQAQAGGA